MQIRKNGFVIFENTTDFLEKVIFHIRGYKFQVKRSVQLVGVAKKKKLFSGISAKDQRDLYDQFWDGQEKPVQDTTLASFISISVKMGRERITLDFNVIRSKNWKNEIKTEDTNISVCHNF